ncbi:MAG: transglycosylase domain-containing protein [Lachnospiraceae bacterium]
MNYSKKGLKKKQQELNSKTSRWSRKLLVFILKICVCVVFFLASCAIALGVGAFHGCIDSTADISSDQIVPTGYSSFVYDNEGNQIAKLVASSANRISTTLENIPDDLEYAFIAIEDSRYYDHQGIDVIGIIRAAGNGVLSGFNFTSGASTITQQLIKNTVFEDFIFETTFESIKRKIQEQYLAIKLSDEIEKDEVLERYLNTINLGQNTLGVQSASLRYFNKDVSELTLSECAVIAGITKSPEGFNPITNPEANATRRKDVLDSMLLCKFITQAEYDEAMADDPYTRILAVNEVKIETTYTTYFVDALTDQVYADLLEAGYTDSQAYTLMYSSGISINSTLDSDIQDIVDDITSDEENFPDASWQLEYVVSITKANGDTEHHSSEMFCAFLQDNGYGSSFSLLFSSQDAGNEAIALYLNYILEDGDEILAETITYSAQPQISIVIEDQDTGYVVALIGGRGEKTASNTFNRATESTRQPGSTFKILSTYAPALDMGTYTLASVQIDAEFYYSNLVDGKRKQINNWDKKYRGLQNYREAIIKSTNVVAVKALTCITPQVGMDYLINFGFTTLLTETNEQGNSDVIQALALGGITNGVTNLELTAAYATIANGGIYIEPTLYTTVTDSEGNIILDKSSNRETRVIQESTGWLLTNAMHDVVTLGTGTKANVSDMYVAGKTGTTTDDKDIWFSGYTPYYTASVWVGYDQNNAELTTEEKYLNTTLFSLIMTEVHQDLENAAIQEMPDNIVQVAVCRQSGLLPIDGICSDVYVEYFTEGTEPTTSCNVHYYGLVCGIDNVPCTEYCPYPTEGVVTLYPVENELLWEGSTIYIENEDGSVTTSIPSSATSCQHTLE